MLCELLYDVDEDLLLTAMSSYLERSLVCELSLLSICHDHGFAPRCFAIEKIRHELTSMESLKER